MHFFCLLLISSQLLAVEGRAVERRVQFVDVAAEVGSCSAERLRG